MARFALAALALVLLAAGTSATDPCRNVVCQRKEEFFAANCDATCDVVRTVTKAKNNDDGCCPIFKCVTNPETPCCGRTCDVNTVAEATAQCNEIFPNDPILTGLSPEFGAQFATLQRAAKPNKGKCCPKFRCNTDANILCANKVAKEPCENAAKCPQCFTPSFGTTNPAAGQCCPEVSCTANFTCLCENANCPQPVCDPDLEIVVQLFEANPEEGRCCPVLACQQNNTAICLAERAANPDRLNMTCADSCQVPVITREANFQRLSCFDSFECIDDPARPCCRTNVTSDCPATPDCQALFGICSVPETRIADPLRGECCNRTRCVQNVTCICEQSTCEDPADYFDRKCDPREEEVYEKKPADVANGKCCPTLRCRLTPEARLRKLKDQLKQQRRRRRQQATTDAPDESTSTSSSTASTSTSFV